MPSTLLDDFDSHDMDIIPVSMSIGPFTSIKATLVPLPGGRMAPERKGTSIVDLRLPFRRSKIWRTRGRLEIFFSQLTSLFQKIFFNKKIAALNLFSGCLSVVHMNIRSIVKTLSKFDLYLKTLNHDFPIIAVYNLVEGS